MNTFWSDQVQSSELLYCSRFSRFNEQNKQEWLELLNVTSGLKVLEVGCGPGHFCNMIKKEFPQSLVCGIDYDQGHINFAKQKSKELNLDVDYRCAEVQSLPFDDNTFDVVFSHTVVEHVAFDDFIKEQKRVLKPGGRIVIMGVATYNVNHINEFDYLLPEIDGIMKKLKISKHAPVGEFATYPENIMKNLKKYGFDDFSLVDKKIIFYNPDCQNKEYAKQQITENYISNDANYLFMLRNAKNGEKYKDEVLHLSKQRYEKRLSVLESGEKVFDYDETNIFSISAKK